MIEAYHLTNRGILVDDYFIISDLHLGYSKEIQSMTINDERENIADRINNILSENQISSFVLCGDIFHNFSSPNEDTLELYDELKTRIQVENSEVINIIGNHDKNVPNNTGITFKDYYEISSDNTKIVITHGHNKQDIPSGDEYIIGHLHPTVRINGKKWACYLYGPSKLNSSNILVLPAFSSYQDGITISESFTVDVDIPFINTTDMSDFQPIVYDESKDSTKMFPHLSKSSKYFN